MYWIVQENLYKEEAFLDLLHALEISGAKHEVVKVVPFSHELIPDSKPQGLVVVMGATTMIGIAQERGWNPGAFYNDNFDYRKWRENVGTELLNYDSEVCMFKDVNPSFNPFFIRPTEDRKSFTGEVIDKANYDLWLKSTQEVTDGYSTLKPETMVSVAPVKAIHAEWRFFVVDGKVITGSLYKRGDRVHHLPLLRDEDSQIYAQRMVDQWQPDRAFVIDVALTDAGYKIIEYNCMNSAGFYKSNVNKLVEAIQNMEY
jgi:hypothetical protein